MKIFRHEPKPGTGIWGAAGALAVAADGTGTGPGTGTGADVGAGACSCARAISENGSLMALGCDL